MSAELVASERLNYLSKKQRAVSSRHSRQIIHANNGNSFNPGDVTTIQIAGGQAASYLDFQNSYLKFQVQNKDTKFIKAASGYDLIQRLEILADGQTISNINNYNVVVDQYMSTEVGADWKNHLGHGLVGISADPFGSVETASGLTATGSMTKEEWLTNAGNGTTANSLTKTSASTVDVTLSGTINASGPGAGPVELKSGGTAVHTYCLPLVLTPLFSVNKYIPLVGRSNLQIRITWADRDVAYLCEDASEPYS